MTELESWDGEGEIPTSITARIECLNEFVHPEQIYVGMVEAFIDAFLLELEQWLADRGLDPID
ncbi:hypothetical protein [Loktanella sp. M215]|uniref:hypothetical protein n=1 Tax=Loktanella sp. M215 TaxID=2675431 RepID=UPI001F306E2B|nr:hypothetical protein [Loktanella sp. M215]MCF7697981.1 hypothetical protein [Loktanella sp. M215]